MDFKNTVVIMTSNIGSQALMEGIDERGEIRDSARDAVLASLRAHFRPEFLNRLDDVVRFGPLRLEEIERIVDLLAADLRRRLADRGLSIELTDSARTFVAREGDASLPLMINTDGPTAGFLVDDVKLETGPTATPHM